MRTNKKVSTAAVVASVVAPIAAAVTPEIVPIASPTGSYLSRARLSGNPLLKSNAESKVYANPRVNGTSAILLAILGSIDGVRDTARLVTVAEFTSAFAALRSGNFAADSWARAEKNYSRIGGNSGSIAKKIGPVVTGLIREGKNGLLAGFDPKGIADEATRAIIGYKY